MQNISNNNELNLILKKFKDNILEKNILELEKYTKKYPKDLIAKYNYALVLEKNKNTHLAETYYIEVIKKKPDHWQSLTNLYLIYFRQKKYQESLKLVNLVLEIKKNFQPALRDKSHILYRLNKPDQALEFITKSVKLNQEDFIALNIMGMIYSSLKNNDVAIQIYKKAILINPKYFASYSNISKCLFDKNKIEEAIKYLNECLILNPEFLEAINNLANIYTKIGEHRKAIPLYLKILHKNKNHPDVNLNIAIAYFFDKDYSNAEKYYKITEKLDRDNDKFKKNYSLFLLYKQDYKKAWELIDGRLKLQDFIAPGNWLSNFKEKIWVGGQISRSDNILIVKEQGVGDEILYSSMYSEALQYFDNCKIEADKRLLSMFKRSFNSENILEHLSVSSDIKKLKKIDKVIFAFDLPKLFRNSINDFKKSKGYLIPNETSKIKMNKNLLNFINTKKIGLTWKSKREIIGKDKSIDLKLFKHLMISDQNFKFFNLQYGNVQKEIDDLNKIKKEKIISLENLDLFNDFENIAALLVNLDLFITISNTTAHLAGALNVPTWLIKPKANAIFHYWNQPNNQCPWYPSIRLIEQNDNHEILMRNLKNDVLDFFN